MICPARGFVPVADAKFLTQTMPMKLKSASLIVALAVMLTACAKEQPGNDSTAVPADLVAGNTAFALDLYHRLAVQEGNLFFSPHSLSTALAMTHAGARGETERDLAALLHFTLPSDQVPGAFGALDRRLGEISKQKQVRLSVANSLWGQRDQPFTDQFLAVTRQHFGAQIGLVDFVGAAERARQKINTWVARKTGDKIQNLLAPGAAITSSGMGGGVAGFAGTSQAAPHVAGALALMLQAKPAASADELENALKGSGRPIADPGNGITTTRIDVKNAIDFIKK